MNSVLIDEHTAQNHAIWFVMTSQASEDLSGEFYPPPVSYPDEAFTL